MATTDDYLVRIEQRLSRLEALVEGGALAARPAAAAAQPAVAAASPSATLAPAPPTARPAGAAPAPRPPAARAGGEQAVTQLMGWAGAALFVLAAAYLIRLVYDTGWFTPGRQVLVAAAAGVGLIVAGLRLRRGDAAYASLLPAAGLVILFLATYGAHLVYQLIGVGTAFVAVATLCALALWLGHVFALEVYVLFAVAGSYSAPLLLRVHSPSVLDLALYFTAWSLVFCTCSVMTGSRRPYLLAGYIALLGFSIATRLHDGVGWAHVVVFQSVQFAVFLAAAVWFSVRHESPLNRNEAVAHLPLLALFYGLQYLVLHAHVPALAPWLAIASALLLWAGYALARRTLRVRLEAGAGVVAAYGALVLFHAVYLDLVPDRWAPLVSLALLPLAALYALRWPVNTPESLPFKVVLALILGINYFRVLVAEDATSVGSIPLLTLGYAVELFAAYAFMRRQEALRTWTGAALWAAQFAAMRFLWLVLDGGLATSTAWALLALAELMLAFRSSDQLLGKSSLLVFAASLGKLVLVDLAQAQPLVRIGSLVVVGVALYVGGSFYKRLAALEGGRPAVAA
jgi:uncharacterized membrane protein